MGTEKRTQTTQTPADSISNQEHIEEAHRQREAVLKAVFNAPLETVMLVDPNGYVLMINEIGAQRLGFTPDELIGQNIYSVLPLDVAQIRKAAFEESAETGVPLHYEDSRAGRYYTNDVYPVFEEQDNKLIGVAVYASDITERKQAEEKEHQQRIVADTLTDIAATINSTLNLNEIFDHVVNKIKSLVPHSGANIMLIDAPKEIARIVKVCGCYSEHGVPEPHLGHAIPFAEAYGLRLLIEQAEPLAISDVRENPEWLVWPGTEWILSYACAPIRVDGRVIGLISVDSDTPGTFTLAQANQLQALADHVAVAIRNAQLYHELEMHNMALERAVAERTEELSRSKERVESILNSSSDVIFLVQHDGTIEQINPTFERWFGSQVKNLSALALSALFAPEQHHHLTETLNDVFASHQPRRMEVVLQRQDGQVSDVDMAIFPIVQQDGEVTSVVCSMRDITDRKQAAAALEKRNLTLTSLRLGALEIAAELDMSSLLPHIMRRAVDLLDAKRGGGIYLYDAENNVLRLEAAAGINENRIGFVMSPDEGVAGHVLQTGQPLIVNDYTHWEKHAIVLVPDPPSAVMGVPLFMQGRVVGALLVVANSQERIFTQEDVHLAEMFAAQAAAAVRNAQLYSASKLEIAERKRTETALRDSEMRYRGIVEDQTELICRFTPDGVRTFVNEAYCRYFDRSPEELIGHNLMETVFEEDRLWLRQHLATLGPQNPIVRVENRVIAAGGEVCWMEWTDRMLFDAQGQGYQIQSVGRDITERKQAQEQLRQTLAHEMQLNELKSRFVSMAAHDLRTPLAVIQSGIDILSLYNDRISEEKKQVKFQQIHATIKQMVELLDDILTLGRAEAGKLQFAPAWIELEPFCQNLLTEIQVSIGPGHAFDFKVTGNYRTRLADPKLLRHILSNLLSNAVKYSPAGGTVSLELTCHETQTVFRIRDEGIGIPAEDQKRLFEAFHRAGNVGEIRGTGLGLAIVKQSVDLHGGTIACESAEGAGTTFTIVFPDVRDHRASPPKSPSPLHG